MCLTCLFHVSVYCTNMSIFQPHEVVGRGSETQLQVGENVRFLTLTLNLFKFSTLEGMSRYRDPQPQVVENYSYLFNLRASICKY